jgi:ATPase subunit of ABC transporter with duplicated ATPase domains
LAATVDPPHHHPNDGTDAVTTATMSQQPAWQEHWGDARGAVLRLTDVSVWRGPAEILQGLDWSVAPGTKWALVGANGAGKSTLLQAIANEEEEAEHSTGRTSGKIVISTTAELAYLQQTAVAGSTRTVYEEAAAGMVALAQAEARMQEAAATGDLVALEAATTRFTALGGYQQEAKVARVLQGLGFTDLDQKCSELSGGWQMRVALAKTLLTEASLTLLDEPSNHLDASAKAWVARYLANYDGDGALILVTHDVDLLKSMDHMAEVIPGASGLQIYKSCSYTQYLEVKAARTAAAYTAYETNQAKAAKLQAFVDRFGASANKASAAQSRVKQIEKMRAAGELDAPADALVTQRFKPSLRLPDPPKAMGDSLLRLQGAAVGHGGNVLVPRVDLDIQRGMKVLIRGPNGAGKSTILHSLRGGIPLLDGKRVENESLKLAFFTQDLAQELDPNERAMDIATAYARAEGGDILISNEAARSSLGRLGLTGEKALRKIRDLSGGEKARVALAMFSLKPSNLYLVSGKGSATVVSRARRMPAYDAHLTGLSLSFLNYCCR